jgi:hypothetical protein
MLTWTDGAVVRCGRAEEEAEGWGWLDGERYLQRWDVPWGWATLVFGLVSLEEIKRKREWNKPLPEQRPHAAAPKPQPKGVVPE